MSTDPLVKALENLKNSIDTRLNDHLCEMKPGYDDSIVGFNEAWDVVRKACGEHIERARHKQSTALVRKYGKIAPGGEG